MTITTSKEYKAELKTNRLFKALKEEAQQLDKHIATLLTTANAMRLSLGNVMLGIAEIEALYVDQSEARRKSDTELFTVQAKLADLKNKLAPAVEKTAATQANVGKLLQHTERAAMDRFLPPEPMGRIEGVEYVDASYICDALKTDRKTLRRYIDEGRLRSPDVVEAPTGTSGRPKDMWVKSFIDQEIAGFRRTPGKRTVTA